MPDYTARFVDSRLNAISKNKHMLKCKTRCHGYTRQIRRIDRMFVARLLLTIREKFENVIIINEQCMFCLIKVTEKSRNVALDFLVKCPKIFHILSRRFVSSNYPCKNNNSTAW